MRRAAWLVCVAILVWGTVALGEPYRTPEEEAIDKQIAEWEPDPPDADTVAAFVQKLMDDGRLARARYALNLFEGKNDPRAAQFNAKIKANTSILGRWRFHYGGRHGGGASFRCVKGGKVCGLGPDTWKKQIGTWEQMKPGQYRIRLIRQGKSMLGLEFTVQGTHAKGTAVDREYKRRQTWPAKGHLARQ